MSTHYLFDANTNPIANSVLRDVRRNATTSPTRGTFVVRVSDHLQLDGVSPSTFSGLITQKYAAILAFYPSFANISFDELADTPALDFTVTTKTKGGQIGERNSVLLQPNGFVTTTTITPGSPPSQAVLTWEVFSVQYNDFRDQLPTKSYVDESASSLQATVTFDNGAHTQVLSDGAAYNVPLVNQGTSVFIQFTNTSGSPKNLASWALVYS